MQIITCHPVVEKRDADTDSNCTDIVLQSTKFVMSDEWKPEKKLGKLGYKHEPVKHKTSFIRSDNPRIRTQTIENRWGQIKQMLKKQGKISRFNFNAKIKEIVWRRLNNKDIQNQLLDVIVSNKFEK